MIRYARPYMVRLIVGGVCGVIFAGSTTGLLVAARDILRNVFQNAPLTNVILIALALPILAAGRGVGQFLSEYFMQWVGNKVVKSRTEDIERRSPAASGAFFLVFGWTLLGVG